jgi:hypothetical protein
MGNNLEHPSWKEFEEWLKKDCFLVGYTTALTPQPIESAPKDGTYIILLAPSGYTTIHWRAEVGHWDGEYRPLSPWQTHSNDSFTDGGELPTHWLPLLKGGE